MSEKNFPRYIFFIGAGASVKAGVNTTFGLVDEFKKSLSKNNLSTLLVDILSRLELKSHKVDIEELLQTIDQLEKRSENNLLKFYDTKDFKLKNYKKLPKLKNELKKFINNVTSVKKDKITYLEPLLKYGRPMKIFSVNYDTAIEQLCNVYKKSYTDGFDHTWNPNLFQNQSLDFHLYKLHGSILWYKTNQGDYLKLPLPPNSEEIELIFGEKAHHLMLYPMQKWEFDEPLMEMIQKFREYLENAEAVIVVGYSFRDPYILRIFHEAARKNTNLFVILIGPHAREIYEKQLRYYVVDDVSSTIPSSLENKVLCIQYRFEDVLKNIDEYISCIFNGLPSEENSKRATYSGSDPQWYKNGPLQYYLKGEFIDRADLLMDKVDWNREIDDDPRRVFIDSFKMFVISEEHNRESLPKWFRIFLQSSQFISTTLLKIDFQNDKYFHYSFKKDESTSYPFASISTDVFPLLEFINGKQDSIEKDSLAYDIGQRIKKLYNFIVTRKDDIDLEKVKLFSDGIEYDDKQQMSDFSNALIEYNNTPNETTNKNLSWHLQSLELRRLSSILGNNSFHEYFIEELKQNSGYDRYIEKI